MASGDDLSWLRQLGVPVEMLAERIGRTPAAVNSELALQDEAEPIITSIEWID